MARQTMRPRLNHGYLPRYTPPFTVKELCGEHWGRRYVVQSFAEAVRFAKCSVACGYDAKVVDAGHNQVWRAAPDAVRNRRRRGGA